MLTTATEVYSQIGSMPPVERLRLANMLLGDLVRQDIFISTKDEVDNGDLIHAPKRRQVGSAKGMITISADFDEPLEEFQEYMA
jgi:hypothetical protein